MGDTEILDGGESVITNAPLRIEADAPRFTATFLGPTGVDSDTDSGMFALVGALDEMRPP
jgi:hypothetical protein